MNPPVRRTTMKMLRKFTQFTSIFAVAALLAPGVVYGDDAKAIKDTSDIDTHIYAIGDAINIEKRSVKVSYADLNLNNEKGAAVLYRRLQVASESVCDVRLARDQRSMTWMRIADDCYESALSEAVDTIGSELLLSLHQGTKPPMMVAATPK